MDRSSPAARFHDPGWTKADSRTKSSRRTRSPMWGAQHSEGHSGVRQLGETGHYTWTKRRVASEDRDDAQDSLWHIVGGFLYRMKAPDPSASECEQFVQYLSSGQVGEAKRAFIKWADAHREAYFEGKDNIAVLTEWRGDTGVLLLHYTGM